MGGKPRRGKITRKEVNMPSLKSLLAALDERTELLCEHDVSKAIKELKERGDQYNAELIAFEFTESLADSNYFGPLIFGINSDGLKLGFPDTSHVTPGILEYWSQRANACNHPVLKARYSGLVWEFSREIVKCPAHVSMARLRIDSVASIAAAGCHKDQVAVVTMLDHALQLAIRINDKVRIASLRDLIIAYEDRIAEDRKGGTWGFSYAILYKKKNIGLTEKQKAKIIHDLETRLERLSSPPDNSPPDPWAAEHAAIRLAEHYRASSASEDVKRVLLKYGSAFEPLCQSASPLLVFGWLQQLHEIYNRFDLKQESQQLRQRLHALGPEMVREFAPMPIPMPKREQIEEYIAHLLDGRREEVVMRIIGGYLPQRHDIEQKVRQLTKDAPFFASITSEPTDSQGRPLARIGSVTEDIEGRILHQISEDMSLLAPALRLTLRAWSERFEWNSEALVEYLRCSPLFTEDRMPLLREGANAYFQGNALIATHLWIPQVEEAIRLLAKLNDGDVLKPNRVGGLNFKVLDELLRESKVVEALSEDIVLYLRALFTDSRGWNLRNNICHGLLPAEKVSLELADRVLHSLLILGAIRESIDTAEAKEAGEGKK